jgi:hypothetical protein
MTDDDPNKAAEMMPTPTGPEPAPRSSVNKITWAQVGLVTEPGRHMFKFGCLTITAEDLAVWMQFPGAAFTLFSTADPTSAGDQTDDEAVEEFRLGTFDLRN